MLFCPFRAIHMVYLELLMLREHSNSTCYTLKKFGFFGGWALYTIVYESHNNTFRISLMVQMDLSHTVCNSYNQ